MRGAGISIKAKNVMDRLNKIQAAISDDVPKYIDESVEQRRSEAQSMFSAAVYTGDNDVVVTTEKPDTNTWQIIASGTTVLFLEYGSGIVFERSSKFGEWESYPATSWSATHGRWLTNPRRLYQHQGWWPLPHPNTRRPVYWTQGNPSVNAMYEASKNIKTRTFLNVKSIVGKAIR